MRINELNFDSLKQISAAIRDVRLSIFLIASATFLLYFPYEWLNEWLNLVRPSIVSENTDTVVIILILSLANSILHILQYAWILLVRLNHKRKRNAHVTNVFADLNLQEMVVLLYCAKVGVRTFKASPDSVVVMSLKNKKCIAHIPGYQNMAQMHFRIYDDIYQLVRECGEKRLPQEYLARHDYPEQLKEDFEKATHWHYW